MKRRYLNARSPLRLLEKGLHGGLGPGNVGVVVAGHGVGKTAFLVAVALDELMRNGRVLHVCLDHTVSHVRAHYDTVFEDLAATTHLEDEAMVHSEIDRLRSIRVYPPGTMSAAKLREAVALEDEAGGKPSLIVIEGVDLQAVPEPELDDLKQLARELAAEVWLEATTPDEGPSEMPRWLGRLGEAVSVVLALEPNGGTGIRLRALRDHDNEDLEDLHVSLDPRTLLLVRS